MCTLDTVPRALTHPGSIGHPGCGPQGETGVGKSPPRGLGPALRAGDSGQAAFWTRVGRSGRGVHRRGRSRQRHCPGAGNAGASPESRADGTGCHAK